MAFSLLDMALPYQRDFILAPRKRKIWLSSRQAGKSWTLGFIACRKALERNGLSLCISTGARAAGELLKKVVQMAEAVKVMTEGRVTYVPSADCVRFSTGARVMSLPSGNPSALRGYTAAATLIDEAAFIERADDVFAAIAPTLTRDPTAELVVASTPAGKQGFFWKLWSEGGPEWYRQSTTVLQARDMGLDVDVDRLRELVGDPDVFDQEYMCRFADQYGAMLDPSLLQWAPDSEEFPADASFVGVDVGSVSDRTAICTVLRSGDRWLVDDVAVMHRASYESQLEALSRLNSLRKWDSGYVDANGIGSAVAEFANTKVSARVRPFQWTAQNKTPAYENFRALVFDRKLRFRERLRGLLEEDFRNVRRIVTEAGKVLYEAGRGRNGHSDATSALVLALQAARDMPADMSAPSAFGRQTAFGAWSSRLGGGVSLW